MFAAQCIGSTSAAGNRKFCTEIKVKAAQRLLERKALPQVFKGLVGGAVFGVCRTPLFKALTQGGLPGHFFALCEPDGSLTLHVLAGHNRGGG